MPIALLAVAPAIVAAQKSAPPLPAAVGRKTPEEVYRAFLIAMFTQDVKTLRQVILPVADEDFRYLSQTSNAPPPEILKQMVGEMRSMPIRALKPGETFALPKGKSLSVTSDLVNESRALLVSDVAPIPMPVERAGGLWRVDSRVIIAARKAAEKARQRTP